MDVVNYFEAVDVRRCKERWAVYCACLGGDVWRRYYVDVERGWGSNGISHVPSRGVFGRCIYIRHGVLGLIASYQSPSTSAKQYTQQLTIPPITPTPCLPSPTILPSLVLQQSNSSSTASALASLYSKGVHSGSHLVVRTVLSLMVEGSELMSGFARLGAEDCPFRSSQP